MRYSNQLEPDELVTEFFKHPPADFQVWLTRHDIPVFSAAFNLLTTLDDGLRHTITKLPLYKTWSRWLTPYTCFVGTTVSEYTLQPADLSSQELVAELKTELSERFSFLIIKDIPQASPLLDDSSNQRAAELQAAAQAAGFVLLEGQALAYVPIDFTTIDDYLARLSKGQRKDLRRKLKSHSELEVETLHTGNELFTSDAVIDEFYRLYVNVFQQSDIHFDRLTKAFFSAVLRNNSNNGIVFLYRKQGLLIGYNLCFVVNYLLIDKYVGFEYPAARENNLYFISWFVNLSYALEHQLTHYVAGWTDPEVKKSLGAQFTFTTHAVHIRNPIVRALLKPFASFFERDTLAMKPLAMKPEVMKLGVTED